MTKPETEPPVLTAEKAQFMLDGLFVPDAKECLQAIASGATVVVPARDADDARDAERDKIRRILDAAYRAGLKKARELVFESDISPEYHIRNVRHGAYLAKQEIAKAIDAALAATQEKP